MNDIALENIGVDLSKAIINEVKSRGLYSDPIPPDDKDKIGLALSIIEQAYNAKDNGSKSDNVLALINMFESYNNFSKSSNRYSDDYSQMNEEKIPNNEIEELLEAQGLPEPESVDDVEVPKLPIDFTTLTNVELRKFHSIFNALNVRTAWLAGQEESLMQEAEEMAEAILATNMNKVDELDEKGRPRKVTMIREEAAQDPEYVKWMNKVLSHRKRYRAFKNLAEGYEKKHKALSREWTMRSGEFQ